VFVRVRKDMASPAMPSDQLSVVDALGRRLRSVELPVDNPSACAPEPLEPDDCLRTPGCAAERTTDGALVQFDIPVDLLGERPLAREVTGEPGRRARAARPLTVPGDERTPSA
jgi:hypothetical protein